MSDVIHLDTSILIDALTGIAANVYRRASRARGREVDIAIAACAIAHRAHLWTLNPDDFRDIPGLDLHVSRA